MSAFCVIWRATELKRRSISNDLHHLATLSAPANKFQSVPETSP